MCGNAFKKGEAKLYGIKVLWTFVVVPYRWIKTRSSQILQVVLLRWIDQSLR